MPKQNQNNSILPFQGGLNTEANRFNYPPECTLDEQNFILTKDGKRERRLGIVLSDEDIDLAPEGVLFEDKIRIVNDEGTDITEQLIPVEETYTEQQNYNVTAKFTGYVDHTLTLSNQEKIRLRVYQDGLYAELYLIKPNGNTTLYKKYNKGDIITLPYILNEWESNLVSRPNMNFLLRGVSSTNADIESWFNSLTKKETTKTETFTSDWINLVPGAIIRTTTKRTTSLGFHTAMNIVTRLRNLTVKDGVRLRFSFSAVPTELTYVTRPVIYRRGYGTPSSAKPLELDKYANLTKDGVTIIGGNYGTYEEVSGHSEYSPPPQIRVTIKGKVIDKYTVATFKDSNGYLSEVTSYSKDANNSNKEIEVITGVKTREITKTRITVQPSYEEIVDAMNDPNLQVEVLKANYEEYNNKTRIQIGKMASVKDRTVPKMFVWKNVGGVQGKEFAVFYSENKITVCDYAPPYLFKNIRYENDLIGASDLACVDGKLVIVNNKTDKIRALVYDNKEENFDLKEFVLMTRDLWGLSETNIGGIKTKSKSASAYHKYGSSSFYYITIEHNWNVPPTSNNISVSSTGGKVSDYSIDTSKSDNNKLVIKYKQAEGKTKVTATFTAKYSSQSGVTTLNPKERSEANPIRAYNLYNRGWGDLRKDENGTQVSPLAKFAATYSKYPSHDESVYTALQLNPGYFDGENWQKAWERLYPELWNDSKDSESSVKAAAGKAIIPVIYRGKGRWDWYWRNVKGRGDNPSIPSIKNDYTKGGPSCCCDYAGHMFYAGFSNENMNSDDCAPFLGSYIFFSRIVRNYEDLGKCYQEGDPSSRVEADIVDTDGGFIRVSGAEGIVKMRQCSKGLLIFAQNGVWMLMGGSDYGFTATNHKIQKLTSYGVNHIDSICGDGDGWCYFSDEGIMQLYPDQFGDMQVNNISFNTVHTLFHAYDFPRYGVIGSYDPVAKQHHWMVECNTNYSTELILNLDYKCFTQNVFYNANNRFVMCPLSFDESFETGINSTSDYRNNITTAYLCKDEGEYRVGYCGNIHYLDFGDRDAKAYMMSGPNNLGDVGVYKQTPWLNMYLVNTEKEDTANNPINKSSCKVRVAWDWTMRHDIMWTGDEDEDARIAYEQEMRQNIHRWSVSFETYRHRQPKMLSERSMLPHYGELVESRSKLRGRGKVFSLICETNTGKDCRIAGMNITVNGNPLK